MKKILTILLASCCVISCMDDRNDYNYKEVNGLKRIENFQGNYDIYVGEEVTITPKVILTIDSLHPDLSYEWYLDATLVSTEASYTIKGDEISSYQLTFCPIDNKTGVKFPDKAYVDIKSVWERGWLLLSDNGGNSELSIVKLKMVSVNGREDSIVYQQKADMNVFPALGQGPKKLLDHKILDDYVTVIPEIVVIQKNKSVELNGCSLEREVYTEEEFLDDIPVGFEPMDAVMSSTSNFVLNHDGKIYHSISSDKEAFHVGRYLSEPLFEGKKFTAIYQTLFGAGDFVLATYENVDRTVSMCGIVDKSYWEESLGGYAEISAGEVEDLTDFVNIQEDILYTGWSKGGEDGDGDYLSVRRDQNGAYRLYNFGFYLEGSWQSGVRVFSLQVDKDEVRELDARIMGDFKDLATFPFRDYCVIAAGNTVYLLWYQEEKMELIPIKTFSSPVVKIASKDYEDDENEYEGPHLGVALENGEFYILSVNEDHPAVSHELYHGTGFGKIVDILHKYGGLGVAVGGKY